MSSASLLPTLWDEWIAGRLEQVERKHCLNCKHCVVSSATDYPNVSCEQGYASPRPIIRLLNPNGRSFVRVGECADFTSMIERPGG